jgi:hypothetical protein
VVTHFSEPEITVDNLEVTQFIQPTISAPGGHGMILIERGVDIENATYRVDLAGADP